MKKYVFFASLMLITFLGCNREKDVVPQETLKGTHVATLTFGVETDNTKVTFVNDQDFRWQAGDQVGVYMYSSTLPNVPGSYGVENEYGPWFAGFDLQSGAGEASGVFSRVLNDALGETIGKVALYPYTAPSNENPGSSFEPSTGNLTFYMPDFYRNLENLDMVRIPMVAVLDDNDKSSFTLKHVGGAVKFTLKDVPSGAKYFKLYADQMISGNYTINLSDVGTGTLQGEGAKNTVELQLTQGKAASELDVYFPVPAGTYTNLGIGVYGDGVVYLEKTSTKTNTVNRGDILRMPAVTIPKPNLGPYDENLSPENKASGLTYQVNVYSFADSDGDGIGDFKGIENHLDYFDKLGVTALWLSPSQKAQSYHGYDVTDYSALNPTYGTEDDFQSLINAAHEHNIRIYMDYVINHTGDQHAWFLDAKANGPSSPYWNFYAISADPNADVAADKIPQIPTYWTFDVANDSRWWPLVYGAGKTPVRYAIDLDWTNASAPVMTVTDGTLCTLTSQDGSATFNNPPRYLFTGDYVQFADNGANKYRLVLDYQSSWGCLIRTTDDNDDWSDGTKWGFASAKDQIQLGVGHALTDAESNNILMPDGTLYYYYSAFSTGMMPDLNYYHSNVCETSPAFLAVVASIDKWLDMGLDGLRLDAIKHIYGDESGGAGSENREFWQKFYNAVNAKYQAKAAARSNLNGTSDTNIFMVGEVLSNDSDCKPFYAGLPAIFEFQFWWDLRTVLNGESKNGFVGGLCDRYYRHKEEREGSGQPGMAIPTPKLSNHDEDRTATELGGYMPKIRLAGTVLLTAPGRPFIYQGEELGYWGTGANGDEYRRAPILWTTDLSSAAIAGVNNKYDADMLKPAISVEKQAADEESLLSLYRRFAYARNTNIAMADGEPEYDNKTSENNNVLAWYMHEKGKDWNTGKVCLVMHNITSSTQWVERWEGDNVSDATILAASAPIQFSKEGGNWVGLPPYSSVVFALR